MAYIELNDLFRFISPDEVKVYCGVSNNVRNEVITPQIQLAQNLKLKIALGDTLYEKLKAEFITANYNPNNLPDSLTSLDGVDYKQLYQECFPSLVWWTAYYSMNVIAIKIEEKGIMANNSDYAENTEFDGLKLKEDRVRKVAEEYTEQLYCYLNENFKDDKDFTDESEDEGRRFSGMYFPTKPTKCKDCK